MGSIETVKDLFDPDRLHDLLYAEKIHPTLLDNLSTALGHHSIFDSPFPVALIERDTIPGDFWADNWTGQYFEFLKFLSRTGVYANGDICGKTWGFDPPGEPNYDPLDLSDYYCPAIRVIVPPRTTGTLTWLQRAHTLPPGQFSAPYCSRMGNNIVVVMRCEREFVNPTDKFMKVDLPTTGWIHNSVRFRRLQIKGANEDGDTVALTERQKDFLLYARINTFLNQLMALMELSQGFALTSLKIRVASLFTSNETHRLFPYYAYYRYSLGNNAWMEHVLQRREIFYENPSFSSLPNDYWFASLIWGDTPTGTPLTVLASPNQISLTVGYALDFFEATRNTNQTPDLATIYPGYTKYQPSGPTVALQIPFPYAPGGHQFKIGTYWNDPHFFAYPYPDGVVPATLDIYPPVSGVTSVGSDPYRSFHFSEGRPVPKQIYAGEPSLGGHPLLYSPYNLELPPSLLVPPLVYRIPVWAIFDEGAVSPSFVQPLDQTRVGGLIISETIDTPNLRAWGGGGLYMVNHPGAGLNGLIVNGSFVTVLAYWGVNIPVGDPVLFQNAHSVFFLQEMGNEYAASGNPWSGQEITRKEIKINHGFSIRYEYGANPTSEPTIITDVNIATAQVVAETTGTIDRDAPHPTPNYIPIEIESFAIVHRTFR